MYHHPKRKSTSERGARPMAAIGTWSATVVISLLFFASAGIAQRTAEGPFENLSGSWSGAGTISLKGGTKERIRCSADYRVVTRTNVRLQITCASDSYKFSLYSNVIATGLELSGFWSESTRNVSGQISGRVSGNRIRVTAVGPTFTALLAMTTRGNRQSVTIESPGSEMSGISITLSRRRR